MSRSILEAIARIRDKMVSKSLIVSVSPTMSLSSEGFKTRKDEAISSFEIPARRSSAAAVSSH